MKRIIITIIAVWLGNWLAAQSIVEGEYFFDEKKEYGQGIPITINSAAANLSLDFNIPTTNLPEGQHHLFVRFKDSENKWGQTLDFNILIKREKMPGIVAGEYFFDAVGDYGDGMPLDLIAQAPLTEVVQALPVDTLSDGLHRLFVRFLDSDGLWSHTLNFNILIRHENVTVIEAGEYFFDTVGEFETGTPLDVTGQTPIAEVVQGLPVDTLQDGLHRLFVRFLSSDGKWSHTLNFNVFVKHENITVIKAGEYFFDTLVEYGQGIPLQVDSMESITTASGFITAPMSLTPGQHTMYFRFKDSKGLWSHTFSQLVCVNVVDGQYTTDATSYCFNDTIHFNYSGNVTNSAVYNWDLNENGNYNDWQSNGSDFTYVPNMVVHDSTVFRYRITSSLCPDTDLNKIDSIKVEISPEIIIDSVVMDISCFESADGSIDLTVNGGIVPLEYDWNTGNNSQDLAGLGPGIYDVIVTDSLGCIAMGVFDITEPLELTATVDLIIDDTTGQGDGSVEITVVGGTPPYSYNWMVGGSTVSTMKDPTGLFANEYTLLLTDANGCTFSLPGILVGGMVGVFDVGQNENFIVFPNPASTYLTVQDELHSDYQIFSSDGRLIKEGMMKNAVDKINLTGIEDGILFIKVFSKDIVKIGKFIKSH